MSEKLIMGKVKSESVSFSAKQLVEDARKGMSEWVLTDERLPTESGFYLITCYDQSSKANKTFVGKFAKDKFSLVAAGSWGRPKLWTVDVPVAWMPLPKAYEQ